VFEALNNTTQKLRPNCEDNCSEGI